MTSRSSPAFPLLVVVAVMFAAVAGYFLLFELRIAAVFIDVIRAIVLAALALV
jgi:hypothetical protein